MARRFARALGVITAGVVALGVLLPVTASADDSIYWSQESGSDSIRFGLLTGSPPAAQTLLNDGGLPCGIALNPAAGAFGKVYWANWNGGIMSANLNGSGASELFATSGGNICGVAVDPTAGKIYWANFSQDEIWRGNLNGTGAELLYEDLSGSAPSGVAIDPANNALYWTNQFSDEVRVGSLNGSVSAQTLFGPLTGEDNPIGVAVYSGKVYWTNLYTGQVRSGNVDGSGATTLFTSPQASGPSIDPVAGKIYWTSWSSGGGIKSGNLDGSLGVTTLFNGESASLFSAILKAPALVAGSGTPSVAGGAKTGKVHTCEGGENVSWASDVVGAFFYRAPTSVIYQWKRNGENIATGKTFIPELAGDYTCAVKATNEAGSTSQTSAVKKIKVK